MSSHQSRPKPTTTRNGGTRTDIGKKGGNFTGPVADNDRDGPLASNAGLLEDLTSQGMGWAGDWMGIPFGLGAWGGYGGYTPMLQPDDPFLAEGEKWGEVEQTTLEMLQDSGMLQEYGEDAVLIIANGPEDMKQLNQDQEAEMVANSLGEDRETVVLWNPSADALTAMLKEGKFQDVVWSGHGSEGMVYMTGADGEAVAVSGDELATMFEDTEVQNVFLNVCQGMGGEESVAQSLSEAGMDVMGWLGSVSDSEAREGAEDWAKRIADGSSVWDMFSTAAEYSGLSTLLGQDPPANQEPALEPVAPSDKTTPADPAPDYGLDMFTWKGGMWI